MTVGTSARTTAETFDAYWRTREYSSADTRALQRAVFAARLLRLRGGRLLDVGCGRGLVCAYFAGLGYDVLGIDVSPLSVQWTRQRGVAAQVLDLERDTLVEHYNVIICLETLQYLRNPTGALGKLRDALAEGGEMIVSLPCEYHILRRLRILVLGKGPEGIDYPLTVFYPVEHRRLFSRAGLVVTDARPISLVPPRWKLLLGLGQLLARVAPSLFALSVVYRLASKE